MRFNSFLGSGKRTCACFMSTIHVPLRRHHRRPARRAHLFIVADVAGRRRRAIARHALLHPLPLGIVGIARRARRRTALLHHI